MIKLWHVILVFAISFGCFLYGDMNVEKTPNEPQQPRVIWDTLYAGVSVTVYNAVIDYHDYIIVQTPNGVAIQHKVNCRVCEHKKN